MIKRKEHSCNYSLWQRVKNRLVEIAGFIMLLIALIYVWVESVFNREYDVK